MLLISFTSLSLPHHISTTYKDFTCAHLRNFLPNFPRYVNNNSVKFVEEFQPEISANIGRIIKDYLNAAMGKVEAKLMID